MMISQYVIDAQAALDAAIKAAGVPLDGLSDFPVSVGGNGLRVNYNAAATPQQTAQGDSIAAGWDWSQAAQQARALAARQAAAQALFARTPLDAITTIAKAEALLIMDELNLLRKRLTDQDAAVAAATSLADLKSRWATVASSDPMPQRTAAQILPAIQARVTTPDVG